HRQRLLSISGSSSSAAALQQHGCSPSAALHPAMPAAASLPQPKRLMAPASYDSLSPGRSE
ncbi:hypothetical protein, partial [Paenibacillus graminis]